MLSNPLLGLLMLIMLAINGTIPARAEVSEPTVRSLVDYLNSRLPKGWTATYDMNPGLPWSLAFPLASGVLLTVVTVRFGVLALVVARFTWGILETMPMTLNVSHWSAAASNWTLALLIGLTLFGFYASRAGQPLFGEIGKD